MPRLPTTFAAAAVFSACLLGHGSASADLPPPPGKKFVPFGIAVENLSAFPDVVLLAYPWTASFGAPTREHAVVRDGTTLMLGRRAATPKLWAVKKADYDAFKAGYEKPPGRATDEPLEAFFKSGKVVACDAEVEPVGRIDDDDPRTRVVQTFRAQLLDAKQCKLVAAVAKPESPEPPAVSGSPSPSPPSPSPPTLSPPTPSPSSPSPSPSSAAAPPQEAPPLKQGGCGGCTASAHSPDHGLGLAALFISIVGLVVRRGRAARRRALTAR